MATTHTSKCYCLLAIAMLGPTLGEAVAPSPGCGKTLANGRYQMTDQNVTRTYRAFVPSGYKPNTAYPLVMVFHGWGGNENEFLGNRNVRTLANQRGYIVVAPRGLGSGSPDSKLNSWSFRGSTTGLAETSARRCLVHFGNRGRCNLRSHAHPELHISVLQEHRTQHVFMDAMSGR